MVTKEKLEAYHKENPQIYQEFKRFTFQVINAGRKKFASQTVIQRIRWYTTIEAKDKNFKINNNISSLYSRLFEQEHPEHKNLFAKRFSCCDTGEPING